MPELVDLLSGVAIGMVLGGIAVYLVMRSYIIRKLQTIQHKMDAISKECIAAERDSVCLREQYERLLKMYEEQLLHSSEK